MKEVENVVDYICELQGGRSTGRAILDCKLAMRHTRPESMIYAVSNHHDVAYE